jgi:hypothetical protein
VTTNKETEMFTAGKLAEALEISPGKVKKLILTHDIKPDETKRGCKFYGIETLQLLDPESKK